MCWDGRIAYGFKGDSKAGEGGRCKVFAGDSVRYRVRVGKCNGQGWVRRVGIQLQQGCRVGKSDMDHRAAGA